MPRKTKRTPQQLLELENEMVELLASGQEPPPGCEHLIQTPRFVKKLQLRKQEMGLQNQQMAQHCLSANGMASLAIAGILRKSAPGVSQESLQSEIPALLAGLKVGDAAPLEEVLMGSVLTLQTLSSTLLAEGAIQTDLNRQQTLLHLGLRAQNQMRQTVLALHELRNPKRAVFIRRQLNQQLNFAENSKKNDRMANELLEKTNGSTTLDSSTAFEAVRTNSELEALVEVQRPPKC